MHWYDNDVSAWGWIMMSLSMALFWALVIIAGILLYRSLSSGRPEHRAAPPPRPAPEDVLAERFARGEIDREEYEQRLATLRASQGGPGGQGP